MERTFPQKVKPVPSCEVEGGVMANQSRQAPSEVNRLVRTSAAVIGLAISVGTCSLPLPNQTDEAVAAEPIAGEATVGEPTATVLPPQSDIAAVARKEAAAGHTQNLSPSGAIEHTVQEGQTLWQLAQLYRVDATTVALDNGISVGAVLHVGQTLRMPISGQLAPTAQTAAAKVPGYDGSIDNAKTVSSDRTAVAQAQDRAALSTLKQKQARLRLSLTQLGASSNVRIATASEPVVTAATPSAEASYKVVPGDTLGAIAKVHGVSLKQLSEANRLTDPNVLNVDQMLVMPQTSDRAAIALPATTPVMVASANPERLTLPAARDSKPQLFSQSESVRSQTSKLQQPIAVQPASQTVESQAESAIAQSPNVAVLPSHWSRSTAVEQTVPAVSLNHSFIAPVANGGNTEVATTSFAGTKPTQADQSSSSTQQSYVENLRLEIVKLRAKYQDSASQVEPAAPSTRVAASSLNVAAPATTELASSREPALKPTRYTRALQAQIRQLQATHQQGKRSQMPQAAALAPVASSPRPQLVATASIGSQNYEPLIRSSVGQMVSPDLPPIGSVDAYLPGKSGKFNGYIWPTKGVLTSGYGYRWGRMHKGIDIAAPVGTPVFAAAPGVIITAGWNSGGYGNMVEIQHPDGSVTLYAHNSRIVVREGQEVAQGEQIADMGSTGYSTGPHSHFEVHLPGQGAVNPMAYLPRDQA